MLSEVSPASMQSVLKCIPLAAGGWACGSLEGLSVGSMGCGLLLCELVLSGSVDTAADAAFPVDSSAEGGKSRVGSD